MVDDFVKENHDNFVILAIAETLVKSDEFSKLATFER